jgi:hypothetical protein
MKDVFESIEFEFTIRAEASRIDFFFDYFCTKKIPARGYREKHRAQNQKVHPLLH